MKKSVIVIFLIFSLYSCRRPYVAYDDSQVIGIYNIAPYESVANKPISLWGFGFGYTQGLSRVFMNDKEIKDIIYWSDEVITFKFDGDYTSGPVYVDFVEKSNNVQLDVLNSEKITPDTTKIGNQVWMTKNLDVDRYRNGDPIPQVKDFNEWTKLKTGAWCYYRNGEGFGQKCCKLYNFYAVNDPRGLAPLGWKIPSYDDWNILVSFLGGSDVAGGKLKSTDLYWESSNSGESNNYNFSAQPGGYRYDYSGVFANYSVGAYFWSSTKNSRLDGMMIRFRSMGSDAMFDYSMPRYGFSVRCIR